MAQKLADELIVESSVQIEQDWRQGLNGTRQESRNAVEASINNNEFRTFLAQIDAQEQVSWQRNERKLFEEVAQRLDKTFK